MDLEQSYRTAGVLVVVLLASAQPFGAVADMQDTGGQLTGNAAVSGDMTPSLSAGVTRQQGTELIQRSLSSGTGQFRIGDRLDPHDLHVVTRPGLYGIGTPPPGSNYGIFNGMLIRFDPESLRVQSVVRSVNGIYD